MPLPTLQILTGPALAARAPEVALLRIAVFRDWPYLYDGTLDYEQRYLEKLSTAPGGLIVAALDGDRLVGASTGMPLAEEHEEFREPFPRHGFDPTEIFYCAESVLLPQYRGTGLGHRFFDEREAHARRLGGFRFVTFCAVERPADHPLRPADHVPLDGFWSRRGYRPVPGLVGKFAWKDIDQPAATEKRMQFWIRELD